MSQPDTKAKIWVYGTLMEGFYNYEKGLSQVPVTRVPGRVRGVLYHQTAKGYPALISGDGWVYGELLTIRDFGQIIDLLDDIEDYHGPGQPNEYDRALTRVMNLSTNQEEEAYVYWYGRDDLDAPDNPSILIPYGDWRRFMLGQKARQA